MITMCTPGHNVRNEYLGHCNPSQEDYISQILRSLWECNLLVQGTAHNYTHKELEAIRTALVARGEKVFRQKNSSMKEYHYKMVQAALKDVQGAIWLFVTSASAVIPRD
jgi:hypothetical protein